MRVALVECLGSLTGTGKYCRHSLLEPLGLEYLAAISLAAKHETKIFIWENQDLSDITHQILAYDPDVVGLSSHTYTVYRILGLAEKIKQERKGIVTIMGGHHVTGCPEVVLNPCIDVGVVGEGEETFRELLHTLNRSHSPFGIAGTVWCNGKLTRGSLRERIQDLDALPYPVRNADWLEKSCIRSAIYPPPSAQRAVAAIVTSRGCKFSCPFCLSPLTWQHRVVHRKATAVVDEIVYLRDTFGTNLIHLMDVSFDSDPSFCVAFCSELRSRDLRLNWTASCTVTDLDEDMIQLMSDAGCSRISFGLESVDLLSLNKLKPGHHLTTHEIHTKLNMVREAGVFVRGFFMMGHPWETHKSINQFFLDLPKWPIDDLRITFFTPFPGTLFYRQLMVKNSVVLPQDFSLYTSEMPLLRFNGLKKNELLEARKKIVRNFYLSSDYERRRSNMIAAYPHLSECYDELFANLSEKGVI